MAVVAAVTSTGVSTAAARQARSVTPKDGGSFFNVYSFLNFLGYLESGDGYRLTIP
jgi:hypothetical protein